jgi:hypothetical protein
VTEDEHVRLLGRLVGLLHGLEFSMRAFLQNQKSARDFGLPQGTDIYACAVGTVLPENEFTSYESMQHLIVRCNRILKAENMPLLDPRIADLRDSMAHGRIAAPFSDTSAPFRLIRFSRPEKGRVMVRVNEIMDDAWFAGWISNVRAANAMLASAIA